MCISLRTDHGFHFGCNHHQLLANVSCLAVYRGRRSSYVAHYRTDCELYQQSLDYHMEAYIIAVCLGDGLAKKHCYSLLHVTVGNVSLGDCN